MAQKIVFIDIDGTLFDNDNDIIHPSTIDAIDKLKQNGVAVCIASGRSKVLGDEVFSRYDLDFDGYVLINGQFVLYKDEVIYKNPIDKTFIHEFIEECRIQDVDYGFLTEDDTFISSYRPQVLKSFSDFKMKLPRLMTEEDIQKDIYQGLFFDLNYIPYFSQKFAQYVRFISWLHNGADIIPINASKAIGMEKICQHLGIMRENVIAFGDSTNDIEMLQYANIGVAMGNAKNSVKEIATIVTDDIDKDGLSKALKKLQLI
ncbi:Cof-type HAD-IIB family hydrolase [Mycoplasmatota bacterium]|nr:Cof-type HAD-IIB family hydrolase [Mycoplasmatota bacterium]